MRIPLSQKKTLSYIIENNNVIVKPGTDLRSKGYVRGKYQVSYNFLKVPNVSRQSMPTVRYPNLHTDGKIRL